MSGPEDPKGKPKPPPTKEQRRPGGSGAGRSASARSIGEELGELDFEPDALLDSLLSDEPPRPEPKPEPPKPEPKPEKTPSSEPGGAGSRREDLAPESLGPKLLAPEIRMYPEEETTIARDAARPTSDSSDVDALLASPPEAPKPSPGPAPPRRPPPRPAPPRPAPPRPAPPRRGPPPSKAPASLPPEEFSDVLMPEVPASAETTSESDAEIDALVGVLDLPGPMEDHELDDLSDQTSIEELASGTPAVVVETATLDADAISEPLGAQVSRPTLEAEDDELWSEHDLAEERPAAAHLAEQGLLDALLARAEWLESEAASAASPAAQARVLLLASELRAMTGDGARARELAGEAAAAAPTLGLAQRQHRLLAAADQDWKAVAQALDAEARSATNVETRGHALYLGAELSRLTNADRTERRFEAVQKVSPEDPRPHLHKLALELGSSAGPPKHAIPEADALAPLARATAELARLRDDAPGQGPPTTALAAFEDARRALAAGDRAGAGKAVVALASLIGFEHGALWLAAALLATSRETRSEAIALCRKLLELTGADTVRRTLVARALEQGDAESVVAALGSPEQAEASGFGPADLVALGALTGGGREAVRPFIARLENDPRLAPLGAAASSASNPADAPLELLCGEQTSRTELSLGRALVAARAENADPTLLRSAFEAFGIAHPGHALTPALELELALTTGTASRVASVISEWSTAEESPFEERNRRLAAALAFELAEDRDAANREYAAALAADPSTEAAVRAMLDGLSARSAAELLVSLVDAAPDDVHKSLLLTEAAIRLGFDADEFAGLIDRAATLAPELPFAYRLGKQHARNRGDAEELVGWLRRRREASDDPIEQAIDSIREALLTADSDSGTAAKLLTQTAAARPGDVALQELTERLAPTAGLSRGAWREQAAEGAEGASKVRLLLEAALEHERAGDQDAAVRAATAAAAVSDHAFARITAERLATQGPSAAGLSEELLGRAREATDPVVQRELYERLAQIDRARGDESSALLWQSAIVEADPENLRALREIERAYVGSGRDDELEPTFATLARLLDRNEATAHAWHAMKLRAGAHNLAGAREMAELARKHSPAPIWSLRALSAIARDTGDDELALDVDRELSERASRAIDSATLALRAAQAADRLGKLDESGKMLERSVEMVPEHWVALELSASVLMRAKNFKAAAETLEALAAASAVEAHQLDAWHRAALVWLDEVGDAERGRTALEKAAELDLRHADVFERLRAAYVAAEERGKLAELLERRLELTDDPDERIALEVTRGRALAAVGDRDAAKLALAAALDANPDHGDALDAFADLCVAEGDWEGAEQSWIRLSRHATEPERQAEIYRKLGRLYDEHLPNPQRAELSYREILKRLPNDVGAMESLVQVYGRMGDTQKSLELQNDLLSRAGSPEEKRDRTIGLAMVQEQILKDRRKAEGTLDKARKTWPQDGTVLRALAEFYRRGGESTALNVLLDRAANDARRALGTGRFDPALFEALATVAELRGGTDAAAVANATIGALHGEQTKVTGAGLAAADARLDELLAPELLSLPLRALLRKAGDALDQAYAVDLRAMRAAPLPTEQGGFTNQIQQMATAFGVHNAEVYVSSALGPVCIPVSSAPPRVVVGSVLLEKETDDAMRAFLIMRALKIVQAHAPTISRTAPIDLWPLIAAFLSVFASNWQPPGIDAKKLAEAQQKIRGALVRRLDDDVPVLALEVIGSIGNRASQLGTAVNQWGNRTALLAVGSPGVALRAVALAGGHLEGPPDEQVERMKWIVRNPEARDLAVFSVSEQYSEARKKLGLGS
jgi:hypothetical protein